jgi:hypothetical protein
VPQGGRGRGVLAPAQQGGNRPANPFAGNVKQLRLDYGLAPHERQHFEQHDDKPVHGVWGADLPQVRQWLNSALTSIRNDDNRVVNWRPSPARGRKGGYNFLVHMGGQTVGHLSGWQADPDDERPAAKYIEVSITKSGQVTNAFPSDPRLF